MSEPSLRVLYVNHSNGRGGAARIAKSVLRGVRSQGHQAMMAVGIMAATESGVRPLPGYPQRGLWYRGCQAAHRLLEQRQQRGELGERFSRMIKNLAAPRAFFELMLGHERFHHPGTWRLLDLMGHRPDLLHCHNLHNNYFDLRALPWLCRRVPVVLTLHDAWLLSGHCAHGIDCDRWKTGCGRCPDLAIYPSLLRDGTAFNWRRKRNIFRKCRLRVATPCQWLMNRVQESILQPGIVDARVIANGVDRSIFRPGSREQSRELLGLPQEAAVLMFAAEEASKNPFKDFSTLRKAVARVAECLNDQQIIFLAVGDDSKPERLRHAELRFVPYEDDQTVLARHYQAADVYLHAARVDTFPHTVLEAQACGTPVIATAVGGIPEQIEEGKTGFLVAPQSAEGLAKRTLQILGDESLKESMGRTAATWAAERFDETRMVQEYISWYRQILQAESSVPARKLWRAA